MARRLFSERAAKAAFFLAALCPFLANYSATALTETLEIFFTALALNLALGGLNVGGEPRRPALTWLGCGLAIGGAILLRPDGGILLAAMGGYLLWLLAKRLLSSNAAIAKNESGVPHSCPEQSRRVSPHLREVGTSATCLTRNSLIVAGVLLGIGAFAPLVPWTIRNLHTFHRFQPLAPRYANDSDEPLMPGFNRWVKTWMADYVSVEEIYWPVPGSDIDVTCLPGRAFDSPEQRSQTAQLFSDYNASHDMTPALDERFAALADERIKHAPLRYSIWLPALRIANMWLRPRTETVSLGPAVVGVQRRSSLACAEPGLGDDQPCVHCHDGCRRVAQSRIFWHRPIWFFSSTPFAFPQDARKSRASLHSGMLSRDHNADVKILPAPA